MLAMKYLKAFNDICLNSILAKDLDNKKEPITCIQKKIKPTIVIKKNKIVVKKIE